MNEVKSKDFEYEVFSIRSTIELRERCRKLYVQIQILNKENNERAKIFESQKRSLLREINGLQEKLQINTKNKKKRYASVGNPPRTESILPSIIGICPICSDYVRS